MKYKVEINGMTFTIYDHNTALSFAEIAKSTADQEVTVKIEVLEK